MGLKEQLLLLSDKIKNLSSKVKSEEATKQSMILPLLQIMGYDIFNPEEVMPEIPCDISNKGDKVDYVIANNGKHEIIIECKECHQNLNNHISQLRKYFVASDARFAVLSNGVRYIFFSDHEKANIMDEKPFYIIDMENLSDEDINFLSGFKKGAFNPSHMIAKSQKIKYRAAIMDRIKNEIENPSKSFVNVLTTGLYDGKLSDDLYKNFSSIIKDCFKSILDVEKPKVEEVVKVEKKAQEWPQEWSDLEREAVKLILGWLEKYEVDGFRIYVTKLANGRIKFTYSNPNFWDICRIKVICSDEFHLWICKDAYVKKSVRHYVKNIENFHSFRKEIEDQCQDTKNRFFNYRATHGY